LANCIHLISAEYCEKKKKNTTIEKKKKKRIVGIRCVLIYSAYLTLDFGIINTYLKTFSRYRVVMWLCGYAANLNLLTQTRVTAWNSQKQTIIWSKSMCGMVFFLSI
jgi:hypothetical protein